MHSSLWLSALLLIPVVGAAVSWLVAKREGWSYAVAVATATA